MKGVLVRGKWIFYNIKFVWVQLISIIIMGALLSIIGVYNAIIAKNIIDAATLSNLNGVIKWIGILAIIICFQVTFSALNSFISNYCGTKLANNIQKKLYYYITYGNLQHQGKYHSADLLTRMNNDVSTITNLIVGVIPSVISLLVMLLASFVTLLKLQPTIAIILIITSPLFLLISRLVSKKLKKVYIDIQEKEVEYRSFLQESIQNIIIVKSFCKEKDNMKTLNNLQKSKLNLALKKSKITLLSNTSLSIGAFAGYFIVFSLGAINLANGIGTFGTLTALLQLFSYIQGPFSALASQLPAVVSALAASERLMEIEGIELEKYNDEDYMVPNENIPNIDIKNVHFNYEEGDSVLNNVSLNIKPGETIALVGPSGQGKTTLIKLILSFITAKKGNITLVQSNKTVNLNSIHRNLMAYVPQGNTLFSGTIKENIMYGNKYVTDEDIEEATKIACAWDFINDFPNKFDTVIGEKGLGLSEGQAQRVSIARAVIMKKPILILDEATSALDEGTEMKVLQHIKKLKYKPTCIIITHRPSALEICNRILKLNNSEIHEFYEVG